jgi:hypothetical protein
MGYTRARRARERIGPDTIATTERQHAAVQARAQGLTWDQVAQVAGYKDVIGARRAVRTWIDRMKASTMEGVEELRAMEVTRLDRALVEITTIAYDRELAPERRLVALEALRRNVESRAKLQNLYPAEQHEIITVGLIERRVAELSHKLGLPMPAELRELPAGDDSADF